MLGPLLATLSATLINRMVLVDSRLSAGLASVYFPNRRRAYVKEEFAQTQKENRGASHF
jgi:hypothetical protein